jgi:hypothetical protein
MINSTLTVDRADGLAAERRRIRRSCSEHLFSIAWISVAKSTEHH